jgi:hypothetical protein
VILPAAWRSRADAGLAAGQRASPARAVPLGAVHRPRPPGAAVTSWQLGPLAEDGELVVSELAANAVRASMTEEGGQRYLNGGPMPVVRVCRGRKAITPPRSPGAAAR